MASQMLSRKKYVARDPLWRIGYQKPSIIAQNEKSLQVFRIAFFYITIYVLAILFNFSYSQDDHEMINEKF